MQRMFFSLLFVMLFPTSVFAETSDVCYLFENRIRPDLMGQQQLNCYEPKGNQMTPFEIAIGGYWCSGNYEAAKQLLERKNTDTKKLTNMLFKESEFVKMPMLAATIKNCCTISTKDANRTKSKPCGANQSFKIANLLIENGADVNAVVKDMTFADGTVLDFLRYIPESSYCPKGSGTGECKKIEQMLLEHGAKTQEELQAEATNKTAEETTVPLTTTTSEPTTVEERSSVDTLTTVPVITVAAESVVPAPAAADEKPNKNTQTNQNQHQNEMVSDSDIAKTLKQTNSDTPSSAPRKNNEIKSSAKEQYQKTRDDEQSIENRTPTAVTTAATGIGGMELAQGLAEQSADKDAAADMAAYIATMRCTYADGKQVKAGSKEIELPGANDQELTDLRTNYLALAADLKERKEALGIKLSIESEEILDRPQTGLYDNENPGINSGNYASLYRATALDSETDKTMIDDTKNTSSNRVKYGAIVAGAGVVGGSRNQLINRKPTEEEQGTSDKTP